MPAGININDLNDEQLLEMLKLHNIEYGPILDSTRRIYMRKLQRVLQETVNPAEPSGVRGQPQRSSQSSSQSSEEEEDEEDGASGGGSYQQEDEQEDQPLVTRPDRSDVIRQRVSRDPIERSNVRGSGVSREVDPRSYRGMASPRPPIGRSTQEAAEETAPQSKTSGLSTCTKIVILLVITTLGVFIALCMDGAHKNPAKQLEAV